MKLTAFSFAGVYGVGLSLLILSGNVTDKLLCLFIRRERYTFKDIEKVWANWLAVGCAYVGMMNFSVANEHAFGPDKNLVAMNTVFIYGMWAIQNTYLCVCRSDLFRPFMWSNSILCSAAAVASFCATNGGGSRALEAQ